LTVDSSENVTVAGDLNVQGSKSFRIDRPDDPSGKWLKHSAIESQRRLNAYTGKVRLDADGKAGMTGSWRVTATRDNEYARKDPFDVVVEKPAQNHP
jgi:hypothetical protein